MNMFKNLPNKDTEFKLQKFSPKKKKVSKLKKTSISFLIFIILFMLLSGAYGIYSFFTTYGLQTPVLLRSSVYPLKREIIVSPVASSSGKMTAIFDLGKIADKIYTLESSNGKNDGCNRLGLFNGYGFRQNSSEWICYESHEQVRTLVIDWLTKHIKGGDIQSALCLYNRGTNESGCTYAMNFNSL